MGTALIFAVTKLVIYLEGRYKSELRAFQSKTQDSELFKKSILLITLYLLTGEKWLQARFLSDE